LVKRVIAACGGEAIDYAAQVKCCGVPIIHAREDTAPPRADPADLAGEADGRADAIEAPCSPCHLSLDAWQSKVNRPTGKDFQMPILHLSQLIGVAAGHRLRTPLQAARRSMQPVLEKLAL
jgi:succinate dehydrogenase / fumarate reductase cytochrome b subunit